MNIVSHLQYRVKRKNILANAKMTCYLLIKNGIMKTAFAMPFGIAQQLLRSNAFAFAA